MARDLLQRLQLVGVVLLGVEVHVDLVEVGLFAQDEDLKARPAVSLLLLDLGVRVLARVALGQGPRLGLAQVGVAQLDLAQARGHHGLGRCLGRLLGQLQRARGVEVEGRLRVGEQLPACGGVRDQTAHVVAVGLSQGLARDEDRVLGVSQDAGVGELVALNPEGNVPGVHHRPHGLLEVEQGLELAPVRSAATRLFPQGICAQDPRLGPGAVRAPLEELDQLALLVEQALAEDSPAPVAEHVFACLLAERSQPALGGLEVEQGPVPAHRALAVHQLAEAGQLGSESNQGRARLAVERLALALRKHLDRRGPSVDLLEERHGAFALPLERELANADREQAPLDGRDPRRDPLRAALVDGLVQELDPRGRAQERRLKVLPGRKVEVALQLFEGGHRLLELLAQAA